MYLCLLNVVVGDRLPLSVFWNVGWSFAGRYVFSGVVDLCSLALCSFWASCLCWYRSIFLVARFLLVVETLF